MQKQETLKKENAVNSITLNLDLDDIDEINFKPISKGLGLENNLNRSVQHTVPSRPAFSISDPDSRLTKNPRPNMTEVSLKGLLVEKKSISSSKQVASPIAGTKKISQPALFATTSERALAYLLDVALVMAVTLFTLWSFTYFTNMHFTMLYKLLGGIQYSIFVALLFSTFYIIYFSILDLTATVGKSLLNIRVVASRSKNTNDIELKMTAIRSLITLFSLFLAWLPMLANPQDKLLDLKVIKTTK